MPSGFQRTWAGNVSLNVHLSSIIPLSPGTFFFILQEEEKKMGGGAGQLCEELDARLVRKKEYFPDTQRATRHSQTDWSDPFARILSDPKPLKPSTADHKTSTLDTLTLHAGLPLDFGHSAVM
ncbi:hypothetical protein Btru_056652, partial [Bulinus truncatus]